MKRVRLDHFYVAFLAMIHVGSQQQTETGNHAWFALTLLGVCGIAWIVGDYRDLRLKDEPR